MKMLKKSWSLAVMLWLVLLSGQGQAEITMADLGQEVKDFIKQTLFPEAIKTERAAEGIFDVRDYGVIPQRNPTIRTGDDIDNTPGIQAAIDAASAVGGKVYLPPGVYIVKGALSLRKGQSSGPYKYLGSPTRVGNGIQRRLPMEYLASVC